MTTTAPAPTTCTILHADGHRCGAPAVTTFTGRDGKVYAECVDHVFPTTTDRGLETGTTVRVRAYGKTYTGIVTRVGRTRCTVRIVIGPATAPRTKCLDRAIAEVTR